MDDRPTPLTEVILGFLTPLMLAAGLTDTSLARLAAQEAIADSPADTRLIATAQTVAFAIAALDSLRLAAATDLATSTRLRLRGNANALSRTSQRAATPCAKTACFNTPRASLPCTAAPPAPDPQPAQPPQPSRTVELAWADAMTDVAAECARTLARLPPKRRRAEVIRINALNATARQIRGGEIGPAPAQPEQAGAIQTVSAEPNEGVSRL